MGVTNRDALQIHWHVPSNLNHTHSKLIKVDRIEELFNGVLTHENARDPWLVIIPTHDFDLYASIKCVADLRLGVHTVCASGDKLEEFDTEPESGGRCHGGRGGRTVGLQYMANVGLKVNLKIRGDDHRVQSSHLASVLNTYAAKLPSRNPTSNASTCQTSSLEQTLLIPLEALFRDVHLSPQSLAALTTITFKFIIDLADMVKERLLDWAARHGNQLPTSMLFYRDGVSESQYELVQNGEIPRLQEASNLVYDILHPDSRIGSQIAQPPSTSSGRNTTAPKHGYHLTFVVVGKRHNTRFYAKREQDTYKIRNANK